MFNSVLFLHQKPQPQKLISFCEIEKYLFI